jgi:peptidoglycan/xylan/chitin deacetylase (PgdA/CDA1 family)
MLTRLGPFRYLVLAAAAFALLLMAVPTPGEKRAQLQQPVIKAEPPAPAGRPEPDVRPAQFLYKVDTQDRVVFLTIDDGAVRAPDMIDVLRDNGIKATLFLTERYARQDPEFFRRLQRETGAAIENHTATHPNLKGRPLDAQRAEIGPVSDYYTTEFGRRPGLFRAPFGNNDDATLQAAGEAGAKYVVYWGSEVNKGKIRFSGPHEFRPGSIVLMHFRTTFRDDVRAFMDQARENGLTPALLSDYLR